jgi:hypothetical protein
MHFRQEAVGAIVSQVRRCVTMSTEESSATGSVFDIPGVNVRRRCGGSPLLGGTMSFSSGHKETKTVKLGDIPWGVRDADVVCCLCNANADGHHGREAFGVYPGSHTLNMYVFYTLYCGLGNVEVHREACLHSCFAARDLARKGRSWCLEPLLLQRVLASRNGQPFTGGIKYVWRNSQNLRFEHQCSSDVDATFGTNSVSSGLGI